MERHQPRQTQGGGASFSYFSTLVLLVLLVLLASILLSLLLASAGFCLCTPVAGLFVCLFSITFVLHQASPFSNSLCFILSMLSPHCSIEFFVHGCLFALISCCTFCVHDGNQRIEMSQIFSALSLLFVVVLQF